MQAQLLMFYNPIFLIFVFWYIWLEMTSRIWRRYFISVQAKMRWRRLVKKEQIQLKCVNQNMQHFEI